MWNEGGDVCRKHMRYLNDFCGVCFQLIITLLFLFYEFFSTMRIKCVHFMEIMSLRYQF
jgi:hypothetical protein